MLPLLLLHLMLLSCRCLGRATALCRRSRSSSLCLCGGLQPKHHLRSVERRFEQRKALRCGLVAATPTAQQQQAAAAAAALGVRRRAALACLQRRLQVAAGLAQLQAPQLALGLSYQWLGDATCLSLLDACLQGREESRWQVRRCFRRCT